MSNSRGGSRVVVIWALSAALPAAAQVNQPLDTRVDGRVLDANNQVGSGGYNPEQVSLTPNAGNLIMTGNVTGGRSFQAFAPIRDTSSMFLSVPSAQLGNFNRDSYGVADVAAGVPPQTVTPFYWASGTATRLDRPTLSVTQSATGSPGRVFAPPGQDLFGSSALNLRAGLNPSWSGPPANTLDPVFLPRQTDVVPMPNRSELAEGRFLADSPIFAAPWAGRTTGSALPAAPLPGYPTYAPTGPSADPSGAQSAAAAQYRSHRLERLFQAGSSPASPGEFAPSVLGDAEQRDLFAGQPAPPSGAPALDGPGGTAGTWAPSPAGTVEPLTRPIEGFPVAEDGWDAAPVWTTPAEPLETAPSPQTLYEEFRQALQEAEAGEERPEAAAPGPAEEAQEGSEPEARGPSGRFDPSASYFQRLLESAPRTFAGQVDSDVNVRLREAEALMRRGEFYNAADQYAIAASLEPQDPLARLGQGHAYLAAGDYLSAVYYLTQGLERFPEVARFKLDLYEFVSDPNILDIRRADLETKLERREDYRLRFLLGYAEYYGGLKEFGLPQLRRAAEEAPRDSIIARFPQLLSGEPHSAE